MWYFTGFKEWIRTFLTKFNYLFVLKKYGINLESSLPSCFSPSKERVKWLLPLVNTFRNTNWTTEFYMSLNINSYNLKVLSILLRNSKKRRKNTASGLNYCSWRTFYSWGLRQFAFSLTEHFLLFSCSPAMLSNLSWWLASFLSLLFFFSLLCRTALSPSWGKGTFQTHSYIKQDSRATFVL